MAGILETETLRKGRRFAIVGILVLVAVITPSGDPISMLMLSVPMIIFYEVAIIAGRIITKRQAAKANA
jgi:sec-independent protein translocase protein TatC